MAIEICSRFNSAARNCFQEASSIFQSINSDFSQWQDERGQSVKQIVDDEKKQFQIVVNEANNVSDALRKIEMLADKVEKVSRKM